MAAERKIDAAQPDNGRRMDGRKWWRKDLEALDIAQFPIQFTEWNNDNIRHLPRRCLPSPPKLKPQNWRSAAAVKLAIIFTVSVYYFRLMFVSMRFQTICTKFRERISLLFLFFPISYYCALYKGVLCHSNPPRLFTLNFVVCFPAQRKYVYPGRDDGFVSSVNLNLLPYASNRMSSNKNLLSLDDSSSWAQPRRKYLFCCERLKGA